MKKKVIRLTESDIESLVKKIIKESDFSSSDSTSSRDTELMDISKEFLEFQKSEFESLLSSTRKMGDDFEWWEFKRDVLNIFSPEAKNKREKYETEEFYWLQERGVETAEEMWRVVSMAYEMA